MKKENIQLWYDAENNFVSFLREYWYPEKSIIKWYKNKDIFFDIVVIEESSKKISAVFEIKIIENLWDFKEWNDQKYYDQLKKYYDILEEWVEVYLVMYDKKLNKKSFLMVKNQLFKWDNFLEVKEFPTYRELTWSKLIEIREEEKKDTNDNYHLFKIFSRFFSMLSLVLFFISLVKCEIIQWFWHPIKSCSINITYPNIILFGMAIILMLVSFLKKIKTIWFEFDSDDMM